MTPESVDAPTHFTGRDRPRGQNPTQIQEDRMHARMIRSPWARLAFCGLAVMWSVAGWLILIDGGFTKTVRHGTETTRVDGAPGIALAYIFIVLSAIAVAVVLRSLQVRERWIAATAALVVAAPAAYLLAR